MKKDKNPIIVSPNMEIGAPEQMTWRPLMPMMELEPMKLRPTFLMNTEFKPLTDILKSFRDEQKQ